ncbi:PilW family protein [Bacillus massiliigorillae]|uniref:PilW family protein n=1 Tax=Bacillus massiliigorillae TaxID=1243664 RepID=UPI00039E0065|nr:prepilin-type N-terminal cleavage/methylation domain-containing protein [Bacillus massiliigorillae]
MKKHITSQKGVTLIELLVTVAISSIVLTVIYSVFATGLTLFQKIQLEGQMRDDADYIATMILNEMYQNSPKLVKAYSDGDKHGIELVRAGEKTVNNYLVEDNPEADTAIHIYFQKQKLFIQRQGEEPIEIETPSALIADKSSITVGKIGNWNNEKTECTSGTIELKLVIHSTEGIKGSMLKKDDLVLESSFGF